MCFWLFRLYHFGGISDTIPHHKKKGVCHMLMEFSNEVLRLIGDLGDKATLYLENVQSKENGTKLCLCVKVPDIENIVPVLTMEPYFLEYQNGENLESIAYEIEDIVSDIVNNPLSLILKVLYFKI